MGAKSGVLTARATLLAAMNDTMNDRKKLEMRLTQMDNFYTTQTMDRSYSNFTGHPWVPIHKGGMVMDQHPWSPMWACGELGHVVQNDSDPFELQPRIRAIREEWRKDDGHRIMTTLTKEYLPYHQRVIKEHSAKPKPVPPRRRQDGRQLIASRWQTPRVNGVKVNHRTETARVMALNGGKPPRPTGAPGGLTTAPPLSGRPPRPASAGMTRPTPASDRTPRPSSARPSSARQRVVVGATSERRPSSARPMTPVSAMTATASSRDRIFTARSTF